MSLNLSDNKLILVHVLRIHVLVKAWYCQATSHYLSQCWNSSMSPYDVTRPQWVKAQWPEMIPWIFYQNTLNFKVHVMLFGYWHQDTTWTNVDKLRSFMMPYGITRPQWVNSSWPGDAIRRQGTRSTFAQVMVCCLMATSHYLNQCWLIIGQVPWHSSQGIIIRRYEDTIQ